MSKLLKNGAIIGTDQYNAVLFSSKNHKAEWNNEFVDNNAFNYIDPKSNVAETTKNGITYSITDGIITVEGTAESAFNLDYYNNVASLPDWFKAGESYYLQFESSGNKTQDMYMRIISYDSNRNATTMGVYNKTQKITIPSDFSDVGLVIRFYVPTGREVDGSVKPGLFNGYTNELLSNMVDQQNQSNTPPPMLTIIDDDGNPKFYTDLLPLIQSKGVPISSAIIPERANAGSANHMTWEQVIDAYQKGADIINHTFDHLTGDRIDEMDEFEVWNNYQKANNTIRSKGISGGGYLVFAGASGSTSQAQEAASLSCDCAFLSVGNEMNYKGSVDPYKIKRYRVQTDGYNYDIDQLKSLIDNCYRNGGWMVWMIHTSEAVWESLNGLSAITAAIDYAKQKGLSIVNVATGYRNYICK